MKRTSWKHSSRKSNSQEHPSKKPFFSKQILRMRFLQGPSLKTQISQRQFFGESNSMKAIFEGQILERPIFGWQVLRKQIFGRLISQEPIFMVQLVKDGSLTASSAISCTGMKQARSASHKTATSAPASLRSCTNPSPPSNTISNTASRRSTRC